MEVRHRNQIRLELIGENERQHTSFCHQNNDNPVMRVLQSVLDQLAQSNATVMHDEGLEFLILYIFTYLHIHRGEDNRLSLRFPKIKQSSLFVFIREHYYMIKNIKGFLGKPNTEKN